MAASVRTASPTSAAVPRRAAEVGYEMLTMAWAISTFTSTRHAMVDHKSPGGALLFTVSVPATSKFCNLLAPSGADDTIAPLGRLLKDDPGPSDFGTTASSGLTRG